MSKPESVLSAPLVLPGGNKVVFREPFSEDRRQLIEGLDGDQLAATGQLDQALAYSCLVSMDGKDLTDLTWQKRSDLLAYKDGQFYEETFVRAISLTDEEYAQAAKVAEKLSTEGVAPVELLTGRKVTFRIPRNSDRRDLLASQDGPDIARRRGKLEESLAYVCLEQCGDTDLTQFAWGKRADRLTIKENQYYQAVFMNLFFLTKPDIQKVQEQAKKVFGSSIAKP